MRVISFLVGFITATATFSLGEPINRPVRNQRLPNAVAIPGLGRQTKIKGPKYFQEPGRGSVTGHYDMRYFKKIIDYDTKQDTLLHLTRAWLQMTQKEGIETWLAHGTLLGWWWNAKILPWDWDLDVQVKESTLIEMAKKHNMTHWPYTSDDGSVSREYLLDINPYYIERERGDAQNMIDARFIDKANGLFIDITGLAETHPDTRPNIIVCKNYHRYHLNDIFPLRDTLFEGIPAKIPFNYDKILIKEYKSKALTVTEFESHRWNAQTRLWDRLPVPPASTISQPGFHGNPRAGMRKRSADPHGYDSVVNPGVAKNLYRLVNQW